jgi:hypothetical protein
MKSTMKLVREGDLVADVRIQLLNDAGAWSPTLSAEDAARLDDVRGALRSRDLRLASQLADRVYRLIPLAS